MLAGFFHSLFPIEYPRRGDPLFIFFDGFHSGGAGNWGDYFFLLWLSDLFATFISFTHVIVPPFKKTVHIDEVIGQIAQYPS